MSLIDLMVAVSVVATCLGMAIPALLVTRDEWVTRQATYYVMAHMMLARSQAAQQSRAVGLRFESSGDRSRISRYVDGDGDGIRRADIADGTDPPLAAPLILEDRYPSVRIGLAPSVPPAGSGSSGSDPVRFGVSDILTFGPVGTATSGTLYLTGGRDQQYAIRVMGATGRLRVMRFDPTAGVWKER